jgi:hypothetical protein
MTFKDIFFYLPIDEHEKGGLGGCTELADLMAWTSVHPLSLFGVWL